MTLGTLGRYRLIRKLAQGGMAEVFLGKSYGAHGFEKPVAIKKILAHYAADQQFVSMLIDEAKISSQLNHPNIVPVIDFNATATDCYLVMEYMPSRSMAGLLKSLARAGRTLSPEHILFMVREAAAGLHHAHIKTDRSGQPLKIVHRDVSPQNILVSFDGYVRVIDFGIARARNRLAQTEVGTLKGKIRYMSPEQVEGKELDGRTDQFALGITLWEALTDRVLFDGSNDVETIDAVVAAQVPDPREYNRAVPEDLSKAVLKALHRAPSGRFSSCDAFAAELRGILARMNPDYDPASLGTLMRKQFAHELEEDAQEESAAEAEMVRQGQSGAPQEVPPDVAPPLPRTPNKTGAAPPPGPDDAARARKGKAQKGMRPSEARRAAEQENAHAPEPAAASSIPEKANRVIVPVDMPPANPREVTRYYDPRVMPATEGSQAAAPRVEKTDVRAQVMAPSAEAPVSRAVAPPAPPPAPRSGALVALMSGVAGAVVAVGLGLVWVSRTDATPDRKPAGSTDPGTTGTTTPPPAAQGRAVLSFAVSPSDATVTVDREEVNVDAPFVLPPGWHRVVFRKDGYEPEERNVELADKQKKTLDVTLVRVARTGNKGPRNTEQDDPPPDTRAEDEGPRPRNKNTRTGTPDAQSTRNGDRRQDRAGADNKPAGDNKPSDNKPAGDTRPAGNDARTADHGTSAQGGRASTTPDKNPPDRGAAGKPAPDKPAPDKGTAGAAQAGRGTLKVVVPGSWAEVELDGKPTGKVTPVVLDVSAGEHTITLKRAGAVSTQKVTVAAGATQVVRGQL
jgi:serine/threonine protein kinase